MVWRLALFVVLVALQNKSIPSCDSWLVLTGFRNSGAKIGALHLDGEKVLMNSTLLLPTTDSWPQNWSAALDHLVKK